MKGVYLRVDITLDPKGRLVLPARLRHKLEAEKIDSLVFHYHPIYKAIFAFTDEDWKKKIGERLDDPFCYDPRAMALSHVLLAGAQSVEIDGQGRILIPPKMRDEAGLDRALVLQTVGERLEIWAADRWAARLAEAVEMVQGMDVQGFLRGAP